MADRTQRATVACGLWLAECLRLGWERQQLPALEELWWRHHDDSGRLVPWVVVPPVAAAAPEAGGGSLEENVRHLLTRSPYTVRDHSGDRTGSRAQEDLAGSLAITFLGMEQHIRELQAALAAAQRPAPSWLLGGSALQVIEAPGVPPGEVHFVGRDGELLGRIVGIGPSK